jgi:hypothetical protein
MSLAASRILAVMQNTVVEEATSAEYEVVVLALKSV